MYGVDINILTKKRKTALFHAASNGRKEAVSVLLDLGADYTLRDRHGRTALEVARTKEIKELIQEYMDALDVKEPDV
jgi:ankyrin repeat protein